MFDRVRVLSAGAALVALWCAPPSSMAATVHKTGAPPAKGGSSADDAAKKAVDRFLKAHSGTKADEALTNLLAHVGEQVPEFAPGTEKSDAWLESIRALAATLSGKGEPPERQSAKKIKNSKSPAEESTFPTVSELRYRFGEHDLAPVDIDSRDAKRMIAALKSGKGLVPNDLTPGIRVAALLHGALPESELAIAAIERDLDVQTSADEFQKFLESWRNGGPYGDESFYEALDRTAGTHDEVFFFDVMLGDFVQRFGGEEGKKWSLGVQHDHNQQAFLTTRQYRGMIEATAFALTMPPDVAMPERLSRYDYGFVVSGKLSYRDELDLLLEDAGGDARKVVEFVKQFIAAHPMPPKLWDPYDPLADFHVARESRVAALVQRTQVAADALAKQVQEKRNALAAKIKAAAFVGLDATP